MRYKIGDVAKILGISTDIIRYYEQKGIVSPQRDENNDYRYYDTWDTNNLIDCIWYKHYGFGIDQISHMLSEYTRDDLLDCLDEKTREMEQELHRQQLLLERIRQHRNAIAGFENYLGKCDMRYRPTLIYYLNRHNAAYYNRSDLQRLSLRWQEYMPFTKRYFEVPESYAENPDVGYSWGFSLDMHYVDEFKIQVRDPIHHLPSCYCIHSGFKSSGKNAFTPHHLDYMFQYARENGYEVAGKACGRLVCSVVDEGKVTGFFEAWLPVEKKEEQA
ncbi:MAG: MerR family transcriptional regulator [Oscillospiraceae bacterium]|jgi:DNA-binding transcriptional MerR regulator|nr:MerR family transcriptional regulator [Oscillospiraceae bacterium]MBR6430631.1 MerR family transcriptional regulator [Oscillospiraceae bacterium]